MQYPAKYIEPSAFQARRGKDFSGTVVFTNGCFDLVHPGHVDYLARARQLGSRLVLGVNSDASVRRLKGPGRPITSELDRVAVLSALECVDHIMLFDQDTPLELIRDISPDILVKGGDWPVQDIVGREHVLARGGQVLSLPMLPGYSTTAIIERILALSRTGETGQNPHLMEPEANGR
ncbi:D-glycero-beta-D-manno-heptose 1-phosphate adenylyltransferase [Desulfovermiculus halophilus]|uniref:D-glycero-beta-D-manno-heptose 1-phosphate adenylyltransferase n=1 Tax=Desulfovermiculus halophilus TaxID=339722 RepID=UPI003CC615FF